MLTYDEFGESLIHNLRSALPENYADAEISLEEIKKNNGAVLHGIQVRPKDESIAPVVYIESYYKDYIGGKPYQDILSEISDVIIYNTNPEIKFSSENLMDYSYVKDRLFLTACNYELNREYLKEVPHEVRGDYAVTVRCMVSKDNDGKASFTIKNSHLNMYGITDEQLLTDAYKSAPNIDPPVFKSMRDVLAGMMPEIELPEEEFPMYVLVNESKTFGASCMFYPGVLEEISRKLEADLHIIPSSIHEVIILTGDHDSEDLQAMIQEVNETEVDPLEVLGSRPSTYDAFKKEIIPMCEYEQHMKEIKRDMLNMGYHPTEKLVNGIRKIEQLTGRNCQLKDLSSIARICAPDDAELKETLNQVGRQLQLQEMKFPDRGL